jgi:hypothetical protein
MYKIFSTKGTKTQRIRAIQKTQIPAQKPKKQKKTAPLAA